ncbi:hypothetical protein VNO78_12318 [Psophocarpus tetragonolobus]|uniref:Uncharacterized protein n=1 Tax=Psophocarpus tetragonolobus TaxID=3891 RepID=A0AAN9SVM6_PSOTE
MHSLGSGYNQLSVCLSQPCVVLHSVVQNFLGFTSLQHISDSYGDRSVENSLGSGSHRHVYHRLVGTTTLLCLDLLL